jgi:tetratricopeptide (TPR) repeat protein
MEYTSLFWKLRLEHSKISAKGRRDIRLGMAYNQMGVAYMMNRDYGSAVGVLEKAFEVYKDLENSTPIMATLPAANMGLACWFLERYDEAYNVLIDILREREKVFGINDNESFKFVLLLPPNTRHSHLARTGRVLHALGNVRASQGRLKESYDFHQRALLQYRSTIGDNHHRTADVCYKVAEHYMRFGKLEDAK